MIYSLNSDFRTIVLLVSRKNAPVQFIFIFAMNMAFNRAHCTLRKMCAG